MITVDTNVLVSLSRDQALVLYEWLASLDGTAAGPADGTPEQSVLWTVEGQLEKALPVLDADYREILSRAKAAVASAA